MLHLLRLVSCMLLVSGLGGCGSVDTLPPDGGGPVDECAQNLDDCEADVAVCADTVDSYSCSCVTGFVGTGHGAGSCQWDDPSLADLTASAGAVFDPGFSPSTTTYMLTLAQGVATTTLTPTVMQPTRTTITVAGSTVASGASAAVSAGFAPRAVDVVVTTESGATRTYTIAVARGPALYVKASNTASSDQFSYTLALSADGTRLAVGAPGEDSGATGINGNQADNTVAGSGAVYVFARSGATWTQEAYVKASNTGSSDQFGRSVSLSADGTRLAVGAEGESSSAVGVNGNQADNAAASSGAAYVFSRSGTTWTQEAYIKASNTAAVDLFGRTLALSADGTRLAVAAFFEDSSATGINGNQADNLATESGAVYVYSRSGTNWSQEAYVKASNTEANDQFGYSLALSADGTRLAVGGYAEDSAATGINGNQADNTASFSGAVYVYARSGTTWSQEAYVKASNTGTSDQFGSAVSLSDDGVRLAVGAFAEDSAATGIGGNQADNGASGSGAGYVFVRSGISWTQEAYVKASNTGAGDTFGASVSLSPDGSRLAVGAYSEASSATGLGGNQADNLAPGSGAAYVYSRAGATWTQEGYVKASNTEGGDNFGFSVSLAADGSLAVGARFEGSSATGIAGNQADNTSAQSGAAYVY